MSVVVIRNGSKLCARCRKKGCMSYFGGKENDETEHVSDEDCECCGTDLRIDDEFGL